MRKTLYLLTKDPAELETALLPAPGQEGADVRIVLMEEAVRLRDLQGYHVSVLDEDLQQRGGGSPFPTISYQDLIRLVFDVDTVVAL